MTARGWELRAAISLARLLSAQGETAAARAALAPICAAYAGGREAHDLLEAQALLAGLNA